MDPLSPTAAARPAVGARRRLGRFALRALLGCSSRCMAWLAHDDVAGVERVLVLPRQQPGSDAALEAWLQQARRSARVVHPQLAPVLEVGSEERWPYIAHDAAHATTFAARRPADGGDAPAEIVRWTVQLLEGLAYAHEAGFAHHDLQPFLLGGGDTGRPCVLGLGVIDAGLAREPDADAVAARREAERDAEQDVLAAGLLLHGWLCDAPAFRDSDVARAAERLPPRGREALRLPWSLPQPLPEALRALVDRATDAQPRQRFRSARAAARAFGDWLASAGDQAVDAHAALLERVKTVGVLPALPGAAERAARLALMERQHTDALAQVVLCDPALCFEMLRSVNSAEVRGTQMAGAGPILTVRRAISLIGLDGVRRVALGLRAWPGPLESDAAGVFERSLARALHAGRLAARLRPAGYDAELASLVALLQNLGRLVVEYHFGDEMRQIRRLTAPEASQGPALDEAAAAQAVLGADFDALGATVARWWGFDEAVLQMIRRVPPGAAVRPADDDAGVLRQVASAANEAVDVLALRGPAAVVALQRVAQRHARTLGLTPNELRAAVQASADSMGRRTARSDGPTVASA